MVKDLYNLGGPLACDPGKVYDGCSIVANRRPAAPLLAVLNNPAPGWVVLVPAKPLVGAAWALDPKMLTPVVGAALAVAVGAFPNKEPGWLEVFPNRPVPVEGAVVFPKRLEPVEGAEAPNKPVPVAVPAAGGFPNRLVFPAVLVVFAVFPNRPVPPELG